ncbi:hypothetical protein SAMN05444280_1377 [Tangfeifania diversioriginum]|uniref:Uncharacterized protein n=1 Tax=Tangfeifania diversioriginum TaxID=1168035 RepID=A0A1M6MXG3_9BACT|nr:hypothetical protein [Tangfeifania diversioriginum]SHJ88135.1 hypothetical protein SAMN05444280_1377 [Tangfeifania diversioriginum]
MESLLKRCSINDVDIIDFCKVTNTGEILWNEIVTIEYLERLGFRNAIVDKTNLLIRIQNSFVKVVSFEEIKDLLLSDLFFTYDKEFWKYLTSTQKFFSKDLLYKLK